MREVRIGALSDVHLVREDAAEIRAAIRGVNRHADVLCVCGDMTTHGTSEQMLAFCGTSPTVGGLVAAAALYALGFWLLPLLFLVWLSPFWLPPTGKILQVMAHGVYGWVFGAAFSRLTRS